MQNTNLDLKAHRCDVHSQSTDIKADSVIEISGALTALLADVFALYIKTKNFHWHMTGPQFRDYHLLLDEHGDQLFGITDDIAERVRRSVVQPCVPSAILPESNASTITTRSTSRRKTCSANFGKTTRHLYSECGAFRNSAIALEMWRRPASSKTGLMRRSGVHGSYTKLRVADHS